MGDLEDEMFAFAVRKATVQENQQQQKELVQRKYTVEPLLIRDLLTVDTTNDNFACAFNGAHQFRLCFIYGRVVDRRSNKHCTTYKVDDGTALINVTVFNRDEEAQKLRKMKLAINAVEKLQVKESLRNFLYVSERLMDVYNLLLGTRVIVLGRPKVYREQLCLESKNLFVDDGIDRRTEVAFKDNLIKCYMRRKNTEPQIK